MSQPTLKVVIPTKSTKESKLSCDVCYRLFGNKKDLLDHVCIDPEESHICKECGRHFKVGKHLNMHFAAVHAPKKYVCQEGCGKKYGQPHRLKLHIAFAHAPKKYACEVVGCGKKFAQRINLRQHQLAHVNYKPFRCKLCGKTFKLPQHLKRHSDVLHKGNATFAPISEVNTRQSEDSNDCESGEEALPERLVRVFTCDICHKHFRQRSSLNKHLDTHNKCFPCEVCDPAILFKTVVEREKHYNNVHARKPFACNVCGKKYSKTNLVAHMKGAHIK